MPFRPNSASVSPFVLAAEASNGGARGGGGLPRRRRPLRFPGGSWTARPSPRIGGMETRIGGLASRSGDGMLEHVDWGSWAECIGQWGYSRSNNEQSMNA
uniref:Uncharacterized protein n=1 Tax=Oryza rufipogon TaxID=4529 RepID=A0A0E0N758_ORYRU